MDEDGVWLNPLPWPPAATCCHRPYHFGDKLSFEEFIGCSAMAYFLSTGLGIDGPDPLTTRVTLSPSQVLGVIWSQLAKSIIQLVINIQQAYACIYTHPRYFHSIAPMFSGLRIPYAEMSAFAEILNDCNRVLGSSRDPTTPSGGVVSHDQSAAAPLESRSCIGWDRAGDHAMASPSNMAEHGVGGLPPALIRRITGLLEMGKEAVLRQGWSRQSMEGRQGPSQ